MLFDDATEPTTEDTTVVTAVAIIVAVAVGLLVIFVSIFATWLLRGMYCSSLLRSVFIIVSVVTIYICLDLTCG